MTTTLYGTVEAAKRLGLNPRRLKRWLDYGYFEAAYLAVFGRGRYRLLSEEDLAALQQIIERIDQGVPVGEAFGKEVN
jgi:DNA-binding transcriptional MerR regulator